MTHYVYMLLLQNGQIYVGSSTNPDERLKTHLAGQGSIATRRFKPVELIYTEPFPDRTSAVRRERQLKGWNHAKKLALAEGRTSDLRHWSKRRNAMLKNLHSSDKPTSPTSKP
jgi:putative endonuclease